MIVCVSMHVCVAVPVGAHVKLSVGLWVSVFTVVLARLQCVSNLEL